MPSAFLLDLDGTLYTDAGPVAGGPETVARLQARAVPLLYLTNTTSRGRAAIATRLQSLGYRVAVDDILTPLGAAVGYCEARGFRRVLPLVPAATLPDLMGLELTHTGVVDAVILGDLGEAWSFALLQQAFEAITAGAELIALSRDRYFQRGGRLTLDIGPFVAGLEYATGRAATLVGKPSPAFYSAALARLGAPAEQTAMVGDDLWSDIRGAQESGIAGWLVRTGKCREELLASSEVHPDRVLGSVAEIE